MDCLPGKIVEEQPENSSYLTSPLRLIQEEANAGTNNGCKSYNYGRRTGMIRYDMHGMATMMRCNLSKLSGTGVRRTIYMVHVVFLPAILNVD